MMNDVQSQKQISLLLLCSVRLARSSQRSVLNEAQNRRKAVLYQARKHVMDTNKYEQEYSHNCFVGSRVKHREHYLQSVSLEKSVNLSAFSSRSVLRKAVMKCVIVKMRTDCVIYNMEVNALIKSHFQESGNYLIINSLHYSLQMFKIRAEDLDARFLDERYLLS